MDELFVKMKKIIAKTLDVDESKITMETPIRNILEIDDDDLSELTYEELLSNFEEQMGVNIPDEKANEFETVRDAYEFIMSISGNNEKPMSKKTNDNKSGNNNDPTYASLQNDLGINIWTSLLKSDTKTEIYIPPEVELNISLDDFYEAFKRKIAENRINADVTIDNVRWDDSEIVQKRIVVQYKGSDASNTNNIQQFLIGLDSVGNFTYIEEKIFLSRPELPKYPRSKVKLPSKPNLSKPYVSKEHVSEPNVDKPGFWLETIGVIASIFGLILLFSVQLIPSIFFLCLAALFIVSYNIQIRKYNKAIKAWEQALSKAESDYNQASSKAESDYNQALSKAQSDYRNAVSNAEKNNNESDAEQRAWDKAWSDWNTNVLKTAYLATTNDIFGRFTRALSSSVKLTIKELFEDKKAELKDRQEKEYSEEHIEKLIREIREKKESKK